MSDQDKAVTIEAGTSWIYKGRRYRVIEPGDRTRTKDADSGNWYRAVQYELEDGSEELIFVRPRGDFLSKFKPAPPAGGKA